MPRWFLFSLLGGGLWMVLTTLYKSQKTLPLLFQTSESGKEAAAGIAPSIRQWGCGLTDTPFIFVHIGKAGGGGVRARLAASALNFTRKRWNDFGDKHDQSYYPVRRGNVTHRGSFCNSAYRHHRPEGMSKTTYEHSSPCNATTPIGRALACPEPFNMNRRRWSPCPSDPSDENSAHIVYTGHNYFGFETNWLPAPYLERWWDDHWSNGNNDPIRSLWKSLDGNSSWCNENLKRPAKGPGLEAAWECRKEMEPVVDKLAFEAISQQRPMDTPANRGKAWSDVYASLPVIRVTVLRDPFSWLTSKFFWHSLHAKYNFTCDDVEAATFGSGDPDVYVGAANGYKDALIKSEGIGWARRMCIGFIEQLCGDDCVARFETGEFDLEEMTAQAEWNLRNAFAVVGLLQETDTFYDMVSARVDYMNMSLNQQISGGRHSSGGEDSRRCKERFKDPEFQAELMAASPEIAALQRLYEIGVEVNRFQLEELRVCSGMALEVP